MYSRSFEVFYKVVATEVRISEQVVGSETEIKECRDPISWCKKCWQVDVNDGKGTLIQKSLRITPFV